MAASEATGRAFPYRRSPMRADSRFPAMLVLLTGLTLAACQADTEAPAAQSTADADQYLAIDWYDGTVEEAFAEAERSARPMFLYWGAIWCPPCNLMKSTLFQQPEFIAKTRDFVAVYLDGDTQRAQVWGEKHDAVGYPTLIVFDSAGRQMTRLPSTLTPESFLAALNDASSGLAPVTELAQVALSGERALTAAEYRRLAYHSWYEDRRTLAPEQYLALFDRLAGQTPEDDPELSRRVQALRLSEALGASEPKVDSDHYAGLMNVLGAEEHDLDILMMFSDKLSAAFATLATEPAQQEELRGALAGAIESVLANPTGSKSAPIFSLGLLLELERIDNAEAPPSPELLARVVAAAEQADSDAGTQQERQSLIFYSYSLLRDAGELERARALLEKELDISEEPYYFMSPLASLSFEAGDVDGGLRWMGRYYREARGPATRFQHGANYVRALTEWTPEDTGAIIAASEEVLAEMRGQPDALANRNLRSFGWLVDALQAWRNEHHAGLSLAALDSGIAAICAEHAGDDSVGACTAMQQRLADSTPGM
ncbi:MAG: thioredoxin fold domain-containing protein [Gammaproteobacteria bacterium]|nr:thioredoxin fold domain-containing protein [Gammaproteobacteria bacterium]MYF68211.1 thioredoxin fold domain-containing protein [Gammaproteobacteria bacterium]MYK37481.1 thioredoxin fold domain-containing protein [Gammaproteobacteria bacterium]